MNEGEYLEQIDALLPSIAARAEQAEELRRIPDATIKELRDSGLMKALQPKRWGGCELDPIVLYEGAKRLGQVCGSTAWVYGILGVHPWQLALFPDQAQRDVWESDNTEMIASTYAPVGTVTRVDGGFRLKGRWPYSSGTDHCDWVFLGGAELSDPSRPDARTFLLPRADYQIVDTWFANGLKGSGTNDIVVEDAFVPEYRTLSFADTSVCSCPGNELNTGPLYRIPFASVFSTTIVAAALGIANGALAAYRTYLAKRIKIAYGQVAKEDPHGQIKLAEASSVLDAAWLQLARNIVELTERAKRGEEQPVLERTRLRHDQAYAVRRAVEVIDRCFAASGGLVLRAGNPLQRFWRDLHGAQQHAINEYERAAGLYGKALLGIEIQDTMF